MPHAVVVAEAEVAATTEIGAASAVEVRVAVAMPHAVVAAAEIGSAAAAAAEAGVAIPDAAAAAEAAVPLPAFCVSFVRHCEPFVCEQLVVQHA
jgi:hypothetical protein